MTGSGQAWKPTTIRRFIKAFPTSARTVLVETDAGKGYLKALGGPEGPHTLACEWVGTQLAKWFGLSTFDFAMIPVTEEDELPFDGGRALPGPAFITRGESGDQWSGDKKQLKRLANLEDISRLVVFDTWTLNCDRYSDPPEGVICRNRINRSNVFLSEEAPTGQLVLKAMDHTHCFTCGGELTKRLRHMDIIRDGRVFGLFPEFREFLDRSSVQQAATELGRLDRDTVVGFMQTIPPTEWDVTKEVQDALADLVLGRALFVADTIQCKLWPQLELGFDDAEETEHPL